jgi:hypothetical protein
MELFLVYEKPITETVARARNVDLDGRLGGHT